MQEELKKEVKWWTEEKLQYCGIISKEKQVGYKDLGAIVYDLAEGIKFLMKEIK